MIYEGGGGGKIINGCGKMKGIKSAKRREEDNDEKEKKKRDKE